jgi:hypothetical protein
MNTAVNDLSSHTPMMQQYQPGMATAQAVQEVQPLNV